jgi:membrane protease YdiL (CAAX protease family)
MNTTRRIMPSIPNAALMLLPSAFVLPLLIMLQVIDIDYDVIADNTSNILRGIVPMVALSLAWGLYISRRAGWSSAIWAKQTPGLPKILWLIPLCWFGICVARLWVTPWANFDAVYYLVLAVATIMVGFNEELLFRGILAQGARGTGAWSESRVMLVTAVGFGLFHLPNVLAGQAIGPTLIQVSYAFVMGIALYAAMRLSGTILLPIAMHALWDFSTFSSKGAVVPTILSLIIFAFIALIAALCLFAVIQAMLAGRRKSTG